METKSGPRDLEVSQDRESNKEVQKEVKMLNDRLEKFGQIDGNEASYDRMWKKIHWQKRFRCCGINFGSVTYGERASDEEDLRLRGGGSGNNFNMNLDGTGLLICCIVLGFVGLAVILALTIGRKSGD
uniref:Uncharacterized protein n=1 Tax=Aplanochytrium stocchinoi TaxID=215587 RepID=A0A7S3LQZ3_9STRA|mmetsp:Transcript_10555/g.13232  ORF Transcript_10555/g.13232 Transcript_10555/m.13232 type:complete len:128 (-) Transcript_10555:1858-2241(-)